jgi:hypothetical protein
MEAGNAIRIVVRAEIVLNLELYIEWQPQDQRTGDN